MKAVEISRYGAPEVLRLVERPDPDPRADEVIVQVAFAGINFADILQRMGLYPGAPRLPYVPGFEVSGKLADGKRVIALTTRGGYASRVAVSAAQCVPIPDAMSFEEAAAIPVTYLTAWVMLVPCAHLIRGETVVIHGAGGGVGTAALQMCKHLGARVIATASEWKHERLRQLGADSCLDLSRAHGCADFGKAVREFTQGRGADVILDPIGGRQMQDNYRALASLGRLVVYGASVVAPGLSPRRLAALWQFWRTPRFHPLRMMGDNRTVSGVHLGRLWNRPELLRVGMEQILAWHHAGVVNPIIDRTFPLAEAAAAHRHLQQRANFGKLLLDARDW